ncbi:hypothetical protein FACS1894181_17340 [Bacteroidia bacterium]|nr:hypothetical protein FACS1894181_17340 [Bacteroidia bacterium]
MYPFIALHAQVTLPDNIITASCFTNPSGQNWSIASSVTAANNLSPYQTVVTGDIDGDGIVEIICAANSQEGDVTIDGTSYFRPATHIAIYKGNNIHLAPVLFPTTMPFCWEDKLKYGTVKTTVWGKDSVLIVVAEADHMLRAYNYNGDEA